MINVDLAILNHKGRKHLEHLLPSALAEAKRYEGVCRVVVVDNDSGPEEEAWVRDKFPKVLFYAAQRNDFLFSYNEFARDSEAEIIILLNNDLKLKQGFIEPLLRHFAGHNDVFSVGATSRDWKDQEYTCGPSRLRKAHGTYRWDYDFRNQQVQHTLFTSGGFMAVDRLKFMQIGGFDRLYYPAYCEDLDLCFRAWRQGWRCVFEPASVALHREHGSWDAAGRRKVSRILLRNTLLFEWSSLPADHDQALRRWSRLKIIVGTFLKGDTDWTKVFLASWWKWRRMQGTKLHRPATEMELVAIQMKLEAPVCI